MSSSSVPTKKRPNDYFDLPDEARADDQYVVEKILAKRRHRKGKWEYLLKWAGFGDEDNTWELQQDIHPDLIAEFERQQAETDKSNPVYSALGEDPPKKSRVSSSSSSARTDSPPIKKTKRTSNSIVSPAVVPTTEPTKKVFGVEKGWRVRAVIGAAKQKDSSVLYAVDYVQGSPLLREYVPSEIAHIYIPRELIEFFQKKSFGIHQMKTKNLSECYVIYKISTMSSTEGIPIRRLVVHDPKDMPLHYGETPGGSIFSTTPGGTRIFYDRAFLLSRRDSPMTRSPPCLPFIPEVTLIPEPEKSGNVVQNGVKTDKKEGSNLPVDKSNLSASGQSTIPPLVKKEGDDQFSMDM